MYFFGKIENVQLITKENFDKKIEEGKKQGHTHVKIMFVGYCGRTVDFESAAFKSISNNPTGYSVYAVRTGYPVYSNCNRFRYDPYVSGVTQKENNSYAAGMAGFINN